MIASPRSFIRRFFLYSAIITLSTTHLWSRQFFVTTSEDQFDTPSGGELSLREAIRDSSGGDSIFTKFTELNLTLGQLSIDKNLTIVGAEFDESRISAWGTSRIFEIGFGASVELLRLHCSDGNGEGVNLSGTGVASNGLGGAILAFGSLTMTDCRVSDSVAALNGGGISSSGSLNLLRCKIEKNMAVDGAGISKFGTGTIVQTEIAGNTASRNGGGLHQQSGVSLLTLRQTTLAENRAVAGAGAYFEAINVNMSNCTVANNIATGDGGGIYSDVRLTLDHCTVASNNAGSGKSGGGVFQNGPNPGRLIAGNSLFHKNNASAGADIRIENNDVIDVSRPNFITSAQPEFLKLHAGSPNSSGQYAGISQFILRELAQYGGAFTRTMLPQPGAVTIGKGAASALPTDQRGFPRAFNGVPDLGAAEAVDTSLDGPFLIKDQDSQIFASSGLTMSSQAGGTLYFKFAVSPSSDATTENYAAGLRFRGVQGNNSVIVGNASGAFAYSMANVLKLDQNTFGELDLFSPTPDSGQTYELVNRAFPKIIVVRVEFGKGKILVGDVRLDAITTWLSPNFAIPNPQGTRTEGLASFDSLELFHQGGGDGWTFSDILISEFTPFAGSIPIGANEEAETSTATSQWYEITVPRNGILEISTTGGNPGGVLRDRDGFFIASETLSLSPEKVIQYAVEPARYYFLATRGPTDGGISIKTRLLPPVERPPLSIRLVESGSPTTVLLDWDTEPGQYYELYQSTDLTSWNRLFTRPSTSHTLETSNSAPKRFFRVRPKP